MQNFIKSLPKTINQMYSRKRFWQIITTLVVVIGTFSNASAALAWKPTTHVYLAEQAMADAIDDGKITIYKVNYQTGKVILRVIHPLKLEIMRLIKKF